MWVRTAMGAVVTEEEPSSPPPPLPSPHSTAAGGWGVGGRWLTWQRACMLTHKPLASRYSHPASSTGPPSQCKSSPPARLAHNLPTARTPHHSAKAAPMPASPRSLASCDS